MALVDIQVPDIGDFDEVGVIELLVKPGDTVKAEQSLITVESDKASMEIPSSRAGVVKDLRVQVGDKVKQGSEVLTLEVAGGATESAQNQAPAPAAPASAAIKTEATAAAPAPVAAAATGGVLEVRVPDIGDRNLHKIRLQRLLHQRQQLSKRKRPPQRPHRWLRPRRAACSKCACPTSATSRTWP